MGEAALDFSHQDLDQVHAGYWAKFNNIEIDGQPFTLEGHEYQEEILADDSPRQCFKKGAQVGITSTQVIKTTHGLIYGRYPQGVLYLFPTQGDVTDFSKARFTPFIADNPLIASFMEETDAANIKRLAGSMLYMRGARATQKIGGTKKSSSKLKSIPVDRIVFDELDEMQPVMIDLALERLSHSEVKEEAYISTPSIPDYGIDKKYNESDQRMWMIRCGKCNAETCLEIEFPNCVMQLRDGRVIRVCKKCKSEIFTRDGQWVAQYPSRSKDLVGRWISQLNSARVNPASILKAFQDPPNGNLAEVYNSKLGMGYIAAENRLSVAQVYACCGNDAMSYRETLRCGMGVDVGSVLNVLVGYLESERVTRVVYAARVSSFNDVHDIAQRFNVHCAVVDLEPLIHIARSFQAAEPYAVYLCDYQHSVKGSVKWDDEKKLVAVNRTEKCDETHELVKSRLLVLPRRCDEIEILAQHFCNLAKVLDEDPETGSRVYIYRKLGDDHYRHTLNYLTLALHKVGVAYKGIREAKAETEFDVFEG